MNTVTTIDLNLTPIEEICLSHGYTSESGARQFLKRMESKGFFKVYQKVNFNKQFSIADIISGKTGYSAVDKVAADLTARESVDTTEAFALLTKETMDALAHFFGKLDYFLHESGGQPNDYLSGIIKQIGLLVRLFIHKETGTDTDKPEPRLLKLFELTFSLEYQKRAGLIRDYHLKLSNPEAHNVDTWPEHTGTIKEIIKHHGYGKIVCENIEESIYFTLDAIDKSLKSGDKVKFNLTDKFKKDKGQRAVFVRVP